MGLVIETFKGDDVLFKHLSPGDVFYGVSKNDLYIKSGDCAFCFSDNTTRPYARNSIVYPVDAKLTVIEK